MDYSFAKEIDGFREDIDSINSAVPVCMVLLTGICKAGQKELGEMKNKYALSRKRVGDLEQITFKRAHRASAFESKLKELHEYVTALELLPKTFLVSLISQYDAFVGRLVRSVFYQRPEVLKASEKVITYPELMSHSSFKQAKEHLIDKEVEDLLRESHTKHFLWLENKLNMSLRKDLDVLPDFIELTERRNLFVHCDGVVSRQYLNVCEEHGVVFEKKPKVGERLDVTPDDFAKAYRTVLEIGIKLGHVLWRKLLPSEVSDADKQFNLTCVELIEREQYNVAEKLLLLAKSEFARRSSEEIKLYCKFNLAQTYKWQGKNQDCKNILSSIEVANLSHKYQLADAVLRDDFEKAAQIMKQAGKKGEVQPLEYHKWPLFKEFRKTELFSKTYAAVFGEPFRIEARPIGKQVQKLTKKKTKAKKAKRKKKGRRPQ